MAPIHHQILIIGGGTAGITVAAQLKLKDKNLDIAIIDPASKHYYQPAWTLVGAGTYKFENTEREMARFIPKGVSWIKEYVEDVFPEENKLLTRQGKTITYDYLVACPGIKIDLDGIEGLREGLEQGNISSIYVDPNKTWEVLQNFKGGTALFTQPATPIKCGGAPQKIMYLAEDYFKKSGVRDQTEIIFATPGSVIFGTEPFKGTLMKVVDRKNLHLKFFHKLTKIDWKNNKAHYTITNFVDDPERLYHNPKDLGEQYLSEREVVIPFDMLHLAPPQSAPDFIRRSKLAHVDGPNKGWINVDQFTLQHNVFKNVFALGDAAALPTAKTGAAIRKQAPVLVENLLQLIKGQSTLVAAYNGYSSCPIVTGYGKMLLAEFKYDNIRDSDPMITTFVDTGKEQYSMWLLKKYGLPFMYWHLMLRGRA